MARNDDNDSACRLNNRERELWINNDEGLYRWYQSERRAGGGVRGFIKRNRTEIDQAICRVLNRPPLGGARRARRRRRAR